VVRGTADPSASLGMKKERVVARKERLLDETAVAELRHFSI
jgi:hypothetical protein